MKLTPESYESILNNVKFLENKACEIVKRLNTGVANTKYGFENATFNPNSVEISYCFPRGDYETLFFTVPLEIFLNENNQEVANYIQKELFKIEVSKAAQRALETREQEERQFNYLKKKLGKE